MKFLINSITSQKDLNHVPHINDDQNTEIKLLHFFFNGLAYQQNISFNQIIFPTRCQPRKIITEYRSRVKTFARKSFVRDPHNSNKSTKVFWRETKLDFWSRIVWAEWRVVTHWKTFFLFQVPRLFRRRQDCWFSRRCVVQWRLAYLQRDLKCIKRFWQIFIVPYTQSQVMRKSCFDLENRF